MYQFEGLCGMGTWLVYVYVVLVLCRIYFDAVLYSGIIETLSVHTCMGVSVRGCRRYCSRHKH